MLRLERLHNRQPFPLMPSGAQASSVACTSPCGSLLFCSPDTVARAGGVVEGTLCYTGDVSNPRASKYTLEYYLNLAGELLVICWVLF